MAQWLILVGPVPKEMNHPRPAAEMFAKSFWPLMVYGDRLSWRTQARCDTGHRLRAGPATQL
jgi:hypothetical protein